MENPIEMDDLGYPYFYKHPYEFSGVFSWVLFQFLRILDGRESSLPPCFFEKKTFFWHPVTIIQEVDGPPQFPLKVV